MPAFFVLWRELKPIYGQLWARIDVIKLLNIHFEEAEKLSLAAVANTFTSKRDRRRKKTDRKLFQINQILKIETFGKDTTKRKEDT